MYFRQKFILRLQYYDTEREAACYCDKEKSLT